MRPVADDEGWERRMSERAKARAVVAEAEEITRWALEHEPEIEFDENGVAYRDHGNTIIFRSAP